MATTDTCVTLHPYFTVKEGEMDALRAQLDNFVEMTRDEQGCLFYGFSFSGNRMYCREGYVDAESALTHLQNVATALQQLLDSEIIELTELQVHGPEAELAKLREPLAVFQPSFWTLEYGFRH